MEVLIGLIQDLLGSGEDELGSGEDEHNLNEDEHNLNEDEHNLSGDEFGSGEDELKASEKELGSGDFQTPVLPCPIDDLHYGFIDNRCVYFDETPMTYDQAIENCQQKLKDYGGGILYEPNNIVEQKRIVDMAYERGSRKNSHSWYWIGVTDKSTEGQFRHNSNSQPIDFRWSTFALRYFS